MVGTVLARSVFVGALLSSVACGSSEPGAGSGGSGGAGNAGRGAAGDGGTASGSSGAPGTGGSTPAAGTGGTSGTSAGTAGTGAGSAGKAATADCSGTFGPATLVFAALKGELPQSLSITGDDLELFYEVDDDAGPHVMVRKRANRDAPFGDPEEIPPALFSFCPPLVGPSLDVSDDGLRLYMTCTDTSTASAIVPGPIYVAERPDRRSNAFVLSPATFGEGSVSISVSSDELTAFWSDYSNISSPIAVMAERASRSEPFGSPRQPPGTLNAELRQPEIAQNGLFLFGAVDEGTPLAHLAVLPRSTLNGAFNSPVTDSFPPTPVIPDDPATSTLEGVQDVTPTLSADCRSLYFLRFTRLATENKFDVYTARR